MNVDNCNYTFEQKKKKKMNSTNRIDKQYPNAIFLYFVESKWSNDEENEEDDERDSFLFIFFLLENYWTNRH